MTKTLKRGDRVSWKSHGGEAEARETVGVGAGAPAEGREGDS